MSTVSEIERAVKALPGADLAVFRKWFADYDGDEWDRQIEADVSAGRLDALADEALADARAGRCTEL